MSDESTPGDDAIEDPSIAEGIECSVSVAGDYQDEDHDDSEDEEEEEPLLKYQRLAGAIPKLLDDNVAQGGLGDRVSCVAVHSKYLLMGTFDGSLLQLDFEGNILRRMDQHRDKVTGLSIDLDGEVFASCSDDGRVVIYQNFVGTPSVERQGAAETKPSIHNFYHPLKAVQLDPNYSRYREKVFVSGGKSGKLVIKKKGWFSSNETEIHRGEGEISSIAWRDRFIAWTNEAGVKIYDYIQEQRIAYIDRPDGAPPPDECRCHMVWENDKTLLIAWADSVKVVQIRERTKEELLFDPNALPRCAEFIYLYEFPGLTICGIAPFGNEYLALLTVMRPDMIQSTQATGSDDDDEVFLDQEQSSDGNDDGHLHGQRSLGHEPRNGVDGSDYMDEIGRPELRVIGRLDGEDVSIEALPVTGFETNKETDYALNSNHELVVGVGGKPILYIASPKDVVVARPRDAEDHVGWALRIGDFERALELAEQAEVETARAIELGESKEEIAHKSLRSYTLRGLQDKLLGFLLSEGEYKKAAALLPRLVDSDRDRWLQWATKFQNYQMLSSLAGYLPIRNPQLPAVVYESVLYELLKKRSYDPFVRIVRQWQTLLYNHAKAELYLKDMNMGGGENVSVEHKNVTLVATSLLNVTNSATESVKRLSQQRELIKIQPLYNVKEVIERVNSVVSEEKSKNDGRTPPALRDALAELYAADGQYNMAMREYLEGNTLGGDQPGEEVVEIDKDRSEYIFAMIERHGLLGSLQDKIQSLVALDTDRTVALLVSAVSQEFGSDDHNASAATQIAQIVYQLGGHRDGSLATNMNLEPLHKFLHHLSTRRKEQYNDEKMAQFQNMQVRLYARYDQNALREFLETSNFYSLEDAFQVCENNKPKPLYREMVFILGRMGGYENIQKALGIIIDKLRSVKFAIEFVAREGGDELWNDLVKRCENDRELVGDLLESAGAHNVDPIHIIQNMPPEMEIVGLSKKLETLYGDIRLQLELRKGCNDILKSDVVNLFKTLYRRRKRAVLVESGSTSGSSNCGICHRDLRTVVETGTDIPNRNIPPKLIVFGSGHSYHFECIEASAKMLPFDDVRDESLRLDDLKRSKTRHSLIFARSSLLI
uniref:Vps41 beta-propeller domain-containing protein n=1 Tax=Mucochytrium quahogii TaxID=96639 RepID=A0A7S2R9H8_9STRA|mmetsp:Transcript_10372/g.19366  ORF Transcript_10372/g.19366 Transcript_10372/m.19366 type:complete len:1111 (+) Transcript_10372:94-3426(+)